MESITETTAYQGLTKATKISLDASMRNLENKTYSLIGCNTIIELADKLMDIRRNYVNNHEVIK